MGAWPGCFWPWAHFVPPTGRRGVVSLIFYFLITPPEGVWTTRVPELMPDPRSWVMPVDRWGVIERRRLWKFHVSSKILFFWAYDEFDEALANFIGMMEDLVDQYTNPTRGIWQAVNDISRELSQNRIPEWDWVNEGFVSSVWEIYDEALDEVWFSVAQTPWRIKWGREKWC